MVNLYRFSSEKSIVIKSMRQYFTWTYWWKQAFQGPVTFVMVGAGIGLLGVGLLIFGGTPWQWPNFLFFSVLMFLVALYRPSWGFLCFVASLPFETINLIPPEVGFMLRPYQWLFFLLGLAVVMRLVTQRLSWPLFSLNVVDVWLALIPGGALLSGWINGGEGMRLAVIVSSFYALYLLSRVFLKSRGDIQAALVTFVASGSMTFIFGILQNIAFEYGINVSTTMPGRPNGSFSEPDWLGYFAALGMLLVLAWVHRRMHQGRESGRSSQSGWLPLVGGGALLVLTLVVLILTVSRSAWLAALMALVSWFGLSLWRPGTAGIRRLLGSAQLLVVTFVVALVLVIDLPLTRFDLSSRAASTATGWQTITVVCEESARIPKRVQSLAEVGQFGCRHITLEAIPEYQAQSGVQVLTVERPDPNVEIRSSIYETTWSEIKRHPLLGIGWGNIGDVLGRDERGAAYNASNVWFELALGAGLMGLIGLSVGLGLIGWRILSALKVSIPTSGDLLVPGAVASLAIMGAFLVFNLFNSGLLIGFVWVGWAVLVRWSVLFTQQEHSS